MTRMLVSPVVVLTIEAGVERGHASLVRREYFSLGGQWGDKPLPTHRALIGLSTTPTTPRRTRFGYGAPMCDTPIPLHQIRAVHDANTIRVYQAYSDPIADAALAHGTFVSPPFRMDRMTWVKPSFLWMRYRAGWGRKDEGQRRIPAIDITHEGLAWALAQRVQRAWGHRCACSGIPSVTCAPRRCLIAPVAIKRRGMCWPGLRPRTAGASSRRQLQRRLAR
jgi:hypothetical protein